MASIGSNTNDQIFKEEENDNPNLEIENPWNIQSIYELQYFNCPSCNFKNQFKQKFLIHANESHPECIPYLSTIPDDSLNDVICPWKSTEFDLKEEEDEDQKFDFNTGQLTRFGAQSFTSLMGDFRLDILNRVSSFSRCLNGIFH